MTLDYCVRRLPLCSKPQCCEGVLCLRAAAAAAAVRGAVEPNTWPGVELEGALVDGCAWCQLICNIWCKRYDFLSSRGDLHAWVTNFSGTCMSLNNFSGPRHLSPCQPRERQGRLFPHICWGLEIITGSVMCCPVRHAQSPGSLILVIFVYALLVYLSYHILL